jgi:chemotaxis protein methyltransferase WspC
LRVLSLPCATGEEPYSIAMMLLDTGVPKDRLIVDAIDISERALARAQRGFYRSNSFRSRDLNFRGRHFGSEENGFVISEAVRNQVNFRCGNILAPDFQPPSLFYDAIFCRNMLIYFDAPTQRRAIDLLTRRLSPGGVFFVGHAEQSVFAETEFVSAQMPMAFAFQRKKNKTPLVVVLPKPPPRRAAPKPQRSNPRATTPATRAHGRRGCEASLDTSSVVPCLAEAEALANRGRFEEAHRICEEHRKACGDSAEAFHLLGLINDVAGRPGAAVDSYRKALYLEPNRVETLMHLALLIQKSGDAAGARRLRQRAERVHRQPA